MDKWNVQFQECVAIGLGEVGGGHTPGLAHRLLAAWKRHVCQVCQPLKVCEIGGHNFAAPYGSIGAKAYSIGGDSDNWTLQPVFRQYTDDMSVVMLDTDFLRNVCIEGVFCRQVFRVQIVGDGLWINVEEALVMFNALAERGQGL